MYGLGLHELLHQDHEGMASGIVNNTRMNEASVRHQYIFFFSIVCRMCFRT